MYIIGVEDYSYSLHLFSPFTSIIKNKIYVVFKHICITSKQVASV